MPHRILDDLVLRLESFYLHHLNHGFSLGFSQSGISHVALGLELIFKCLEFLIAHDLLFPQFQFLLFQHNFRIGLRLWQIHQDVDVFDPASFQNPSGGFNGVHCPHLHKGNQGLRLLRFFLIRDNRGIGCRNNVYRVILIIDPADLPLFLGIRIQNREILGIPDILLVQGKEFPIFLA